MLSTRFRCSSHTHLLFHHLVSLLQAVITDMAIDARKQYAHLVLGRPQKEQLVFLLATRQFALKSHQLNHIPSPQLPSSNNHDLNHARCLRMIYLSALLRFRIILDEF